MEVDALFKLIAVLNKEEKIKIFNFLLEKKEATLKEISEVTGVKLSTASKYLKELERAKIVKAERKKKKASKFYLGENASKLMPFLQFRKGISVIDEEGRLRLYNFSTLLEEGKKVGIDELFLRKIIHETLSKCYDGVYLLDLIAILRKKIAEEIEKLRLLSSRITLKFGKEAELLEHIKKTNPEVARLFFDGVIEIRNIGEPTLISLVHDLDFLIRKGLRPFNIEAKPPTNIHSLLSHIFTLVDACNQELADHQQAIDNFNIYLSPFISNLSDTELKQVCERIIYTFDQMYEVKGVKTHRTVLLLEVDVPKYLEKKPVVIKGKAIGEYKDFSGEAKSLLETLLRIYKQKKKKTNPKIFIKIRNKKQINEISEFLDLVYIINEIPGWQGENAVYLYDWVRISGEFKDTSRAPEIQFCTLNLPRIAYESKEEDTFIERLKDIIGKVLRSFDTVIGKIKQAIPTKRFINPSYVNIKNGISLIGITGMRETIEFLAGKYSENIDLALKMLKEMNKELERTPYKLGLVEVDFSPITRRFLSSCRRIGFPLKRMTGGIDLPTDPITKINLLSKLHPFLTGGHLLRVKSLSQEVLDLALKKEVGMITGEALDII